MSGTDRPVLVTGAAGFIGSRVVELLLDRGDRVIGLDNFDPYYDPAIKRMNIAPSLARPGYRLIEGDIRDPEALDRAFEAAPFKGIIHLAARAGVRPSIDQPLLYQSVNVRGTYMLLERAREQLPTHFVFASSSSVYGSTSEPPFREDDRADRPSSVYAATKRSGELACHSYHHIYGLDTTCLRFFTVYGPRQRPEMAIHRFTRSIDRGEVIDIFGDGTSVRDYTYIDDVATGVIAALDRPDGYAVYNLGASGLTRLIDLVSMIANRLDRPLLLRYLPDQPGDVPLTHADVSLAQQLLGYQVTTPIAVGLDRFIEWYQSTAVPLHTQRPASYSL